MLSYSCDMMDMMEGQDMILSPLFFFITVEKYLEHRIGRA